MNHPSPQLIQISLGTIIKVVLVLLGFYTLYLLNEVVLVLLTSVVIASAVEPAAVWFVRRKVPRTVAVILVYLITFSVFAILFFLFIPPIIKDFTQFVSSLPARLHFLDTWNPWRDTFDYQTVLQNILVSQNFVSSGTSTGTDIANTIGGIFGGLVDSILVLVISFYLSVQERGIENFLKIIVPLKHEDYILDLWKRSQAKIGRWMQGQILLAVLVGALVFLGLMILGVPNAFVFAILAAVCELIPVFGPIVAAIPAVAVAFSDSVGLGLATTGLYLIIQQFENHLIYPVVVRKVVGVPPILVIISLLIGAKLVGVVGIILSVPLAAAIMEYVNDLEKKRAEIMAG